MPMPEHSIAYLLLLVIAWQRLSDISIYEVCINRLVFGILSLINLFPHQKQLEGKQSLGPAMKVVGAKLMVNQWTLGKRFEAKDGYH